MTEVAVWILVDIGEARIRALDAVSRQSKRSRAALIRDAIEEYLERHRRDQQADAFGLWGDRKIDGLEYQEKIGSEW